MHSKNLKAERIYDLWEDDQYFLFNIHNNIDIILRDVNTILEADCFRNRDEKTSLEEFKRREIIEEEKVSADAGYHGALNRLVKLIKKYDNNFDLFNPSDPQSFML